MGQVQKKFDPTKPVQTRDGRPARIIATDRRNNTFPIVALVGPDERPETYTAKGAYFDSTSRYEDDLVNIPQKVTKWGRLYRAPDGGVIPGSDLFDTREEAERPRPNKILQFISVFPVEYEE